MAVNLEAADRLFVIVPRSDGQPVGISRTESAIQFVYVDAPIHFWGFSKVGDKKYLIRIGGYPYTGVIDDKVTASLNPEDEVTWEITHHLYNNGYTITLADDPSIGWTTNEGTGKIEVRPIKATPSFPPQYQPNQLFLFDLFKE